MKKVSKEQSQVEYEEGQKMWLNMKFFTLSKALTPKFIAKYVGPFIILKQFFKDFNKLELPLEIKVHPNLYVLLFKPYYEDTLRLSSDCRYLNEDMNL